jgi:hypothetical protein
MSEPTKQEMVAVILKKQEEDFDRRDHAERLAALKRISENGQPWNNPLFGAFDPSVEYTLAELKAMVPLERDRLNYEWKNEDKGTQGVFAKNKYGLYSIPKGHGRIKPHMNLRRQAVKAAALRIFETLFAEAAQRLEATCKEEKIEYLGIPDAMIPELGEKAARIAIREVAAQRKATARSKRRRQEFSRRVNAGLITISASEKRYVNQGGQYGR